MPRNVPHLWVLQSIQYLFFHSGYSYNYLDILYFKHGLNFISVSLLYNCDEFGTWILKLGLDWVELLQCHRSHNIFHTNHLQLCGQMNVMGGKDKICQKSLNSEECLQSIEVEK